MRTLIDLQKKLYPNILEEMKLRYSVLNAVNLLQPVGRRGLAENIDLTERIVRSEVAFLNDQGFIEVTSKGMYISRAGSLILEQLANFIQEVMGINDLEKLLRDKLQIKHVIVVPGNSDVINWVKNEMGKACVSYLKMYLKEKATIAVTGGTTMAAVANAMEPLTKQGNCLFVPARGGIGEKEENQANTIAAQMARKSKGEYRLLYVPDPLSELSYQTMMKEPSIHETLLLIKGSDVVLHGIGDALTLAQRRKSSESVVKRLKERKAVSEAFGYYFDQAGHIVHRVRTIGIHLKDLSNEKYVIAVAGGQSKANAIISYFQKGKSDLLITDEGAAHQILSRN